MYFGRKNHGYIPYPTHIRHWSLNIVQMEKKILFIENNSSFLTNAIQNNLKNDDFICEKVPYDVDVIDSIKEDYSSFFLFIESDTFHNSSSELIFLRDICKNYDKGIFLMGDQADILEVNTIIDEKIVWDVFLRPVNARDVTERVNIAYTKAETTDQKKHILVVDDSGTFLHTMKQWLEPQYKVTIVNSATTAISCLNKVKPDLILLDYEMPVCNGPMMLEMIRNDVEFSDIPVIFLTGKGDKDSVRRVLTLKPQGYLLKNLPQNKILETIGNFFLAMKAREL